VRKEKRRSSFFFSSSKALKKSKMNKKKVVSRTSQSTSGELRKSLCFSRGSIRGEEAVVARTIGASKDINEDLSGVSNQGA